MIPGVPLDLELACGGYLRSAHGRLRPVPGLEEVAELACRLDVSAVWGYPPGNKAAVTYLWSKTIVLHPRVYSWPSEHVVDVLSHECGHVVRGRSCNSARSWQRRWFAHLLPAEERTG